MTEVRMVKAQARAIVAELKKVAASEASKWGPLAIWVLITGLVDH